MSGRTVRRFVEGLRRGRSTEPARPDDLEAQEMKTAIELRAAPLGSDSPREEFVTDLHRRLADAMDETNTPKPPTRWAPTGTRRQVVIGTGLAAASATAGIVVGRNGAGREQRAVNHSVRPRGPGAQRRCLAGGRRKRRPA